MIWLDYKGVLDIWPFELLGSDSVHVWLLSVQCVCLAAGLNASIPMTCVIYLYLNVI